MEWVANMPPHILKGYEHLPHHEDSLIQIKELEDTNDLPGSNLDVTE